METIRPTRSEVAQRLINGAICEKNLVDAHLALDECVVAGHSDIQFWQQPAFVIGGFTVSIGLTMALVCLTHAMGACK